MKKKTRRVKAGTGEKLQYLAHAFNDSTIRFVLHYDFIPDAQALKTAVRHAVMSVDVLHACFVKTSRGVHWQVQDALMDGDDFSLILADDPMEQAVQASLQPIAPESRCQIHVSLFCGKGESALCVRMSHLCVDGGDAKYLLDRIFDGFHLVREKGDCAGLRIKNGSRRPEQVYAHLNKAEIKGLMKSPLTGVKSLFPFPQGGECAPRLPMVKIDGGTMEKARVRGKKDGATVNDILLAAAYRAYGRLPGVQPGEKVSIMSMMDLRRHCLGGDTQGLCNLSGSLPTVVQRPDADFEKILASVAEQTRRLKEMPLAGMEGMPLLHGVIRLLPVGVSLKAAARVYGHMSVGMTNLGNLCGAHWALEGHCPDDLVFAGPVKKKPNMQISAASLDEQCVLTAAVCCTKEDARLLQGMLEDMKKIITAYAENG